MNRFILALLAALSVVACDNETSSRSSKVEAEVPAAPVIPSLDVQSLVDLSKNERQELERRCLGVEHKTCSNLKSDSFQKSMDLKRSFCQAGSSMDAITGGMGGSRKNCDDL